MDMRQAAAAARVLPELHDFNARPALETAISVCYARPWIPSNLGGKLKDKWLPAAGPDHDLHRRLVEPRRKTYAHTDPAGGRTVSAQRGWRTFLRSSSNGNHCRWIIYPRSLTCASGRRHSL